MYPIKWWDQEKSKLADLESYFDLCLGNWKISRLCSCRIQSDRYQQAERNTKNRTDHWISRRTSQEIWKWKRKLLISKLKAVSFPKDLQLFGSLFWSVLNGSNLPKKWQYLLKREPHLILAQPEIDFLAKEPSIGRYKNKFWDFLIVDFSDFFQTFFEIFARLFRTLSTYQLTILKNSVKRKVIEENFVGCDKSKLKLLI